MPESPVKEIIFVYNADSGIVNSWLDIAHKVIRPETYSCDLCALTHGSFREKGVWKKFREDAKIPIIFYHKDEFLKKFKSKWLPRYDFPLVLTTNGVTMEPFITAQDFKEIKTVEVLMERLQALTL